MNELGTRHLESPAILWTSVILFGLFAVQTAYQIYHVRQNHVQVDANLSAELADAVFVEDEPAPESAGWPQWRGPNRDGVIRMNDLSSDWPKKGPPLLWERPIGLGYSSFAVKEGRLYSMFRSGEKEVVACWRVHDGEEVWRRPYDCRTEVDYAGPRSTPTLEGDRLYSVGSEGTLLCLDAASGSLHWQKNLLREFHASAPRWGVAFSPLIEGDLIFTCPGGPNGNSLAAFNKITGELVWKSLDEPTGYSSPVAVTIAGTRQILFFMGKCLVAVRAKDGQFCWRYPWTTSYDVNASTPLFITASRNERTSAGHGNVDNYVFISSGYGRGSALLKITATDHGRFEAQTVFIGKQMSCHFASPVRRGEYLYGIDDSRLSCLNLRTGKIVWKRSGIQKGSLLRVNDYLLVLGEEGQLWLLDAVPEQRASVSETRPFHGGRCWTMPVIAEGKLFLRDERQMKCYDLRKMSSLIEKEQSSGR
jgi:outer membrane protein assembly factor BamB